jgi:DNA-binding LacI/PurR family transcriptional regulator
MQQRKPTIHDVAREAFVSRATASRVINNGRGVSEQVRSRVNQVIADLGYIPNPAAQTLASGRANVIELVVVAYDADVARFGVHPYFSRIVAGMVSALYGTDTRMRVHVACETDAAELLERVAQTSSLGAVLVNVPALLAAQFHERRPRAVSIGATAPRVPAVEAENVQGARAAVGYLHSLGRRGIAAIHGPASNTCAASRRIGHLDAIHELGLPDLAADGDFHREGGYRAAAQLMRLHPHIDAFFVACDLMATGAIQAITASGRRVPEDVSVVSFDDSVIAACSNPPMTSMRLPVEEMAAAAARALIDGSVPPCWRRIFPVELVVRESAGPAPAVPWQARRPLSRAGGPSR